MTDLNPHVTQMADESMVRNLTAQIEAIWPQELPLYRRYGLDGELAILDAGCGTGEAASRLAALYPRARVLGVDILDPHLDLARRRYAGVGPRLTFENRSIYELGLPDRAYDLVVCRHVLHSIPHADRVIAELARVTKRGGRLHLIPEDYDMLHFQRTAPDPREFWNEVPDRFGQHTGTDLFVGRHAFTAFQKLGLQDITLDYIIVDTLRCPREVFARIIEAWRDGYAGVSAEVMGWPLERAQDYFNRMIANIRDPEAYAVWMVPVLAARVP
jgi:ubiquinone/menaquinone biosynthesis C-methylase UbiE